MRHEILLESIESHRQRTGVAPWPQAHVDAKHPAVFGRLGKQRDQALAQRAEILVIGQGAPALRIAFFGVQENQVDIGGDIEFAAAELAHADHDQVLATGCEVPAAGNRHLQRRHAQRGFQFGADGGQARIDGHFGQRRHDAAHFSKAGESRQVALHDAQHHAGPQLPQRAAQLIRRRYGSVRKTDELPHRRGGPRSMACRDELFFQVGLGFKQCAGKARISRRQRVMG